MAAKTMCIMLVVVLLSGTQVQASQARAKSAHRAQQVPQSSSQPVAPPNPNPLDGLELVASEMPPGYPTVNLTQLAPILPLLANLNVSVVMTWVPVIERTSPAAWAAMPPVLNQLNASTLEGILAGLPSLNWGIIADLMPLVNAIPPNYLTTYIQAAGLIDPKIVQAMLPGILSVPPEWINKVLPAMAGLDADWLASILKAISPLLVKINPDQIVALMPALSTLSVETWQKMIELLTKISPAGLELLVHLLDITGPYLDKIINILNTMRRILPIDAGTVDGKTTVFARPPGQPGFGPASLILGQKPLPQSPPNNGAAPAPVAAPVPVPQFPRTLPPLGGQPAAPSSSAPKPASSSAPKAASSSAPKAAGSSAPKPASAGASSKGRRL